MFWDQPLGPLDTFWTFRYLLEFRDVLELQVPLGWLGTSWTFRYLLELTRTHAIDMHSIDNDHCIYLYLWYSHDIGKDSWQRHGLTVQTYTHSNNNTHGIDKESRYRISSTESHTYQRDECCPCIGFFSSSLINQEKVRSRFLHKNPSDNFDCQQLCSVVQAPGPCSRIMKL